MLRIGIFLTVLFPGSLYAQVGPNFKVTYSNVYEVPGGSRKVYKELTVKKEQAGTEEEPRSTEEPLRPLPVSEPAFFYSPALSPELLNGIPNWRFGSDPQGNTTLTLKVHLFNEYFKEAAKESLHERYPDQKKFVLLPLPIKELSVTVSELSQLPVGVRLKNEGVPRPNPSSRAFFWLELQLDENIWTGDDLEELKQLLKQCKFQIRLLYDAETANTNELYVGISTRAINQMKAELSGNSAPGPGGARYVSRDDYQNYVQRLQSSSQIHAIIRDPGMFSQQFAQRVLDLLQANEVEVSIAAWLAAAEKTQYDPNDLRADVLARDFNQEQDEASGSESVKTQQKVGGGFGIKGFQITAETDAAKEKFKSFSRRRGITGEWEGHVFVPKILKVHQVNVARLDATRSFTMSAAAVTRQLFHEAYLFELRNVLEVDSPLEQQQQQSRQAFLLMKETHQKEKEELRTQFEKEKQELRDQLTPEPKKRSTVSRTFVITSQLTGCWPLWRGDTHPGTTKSDLKVYCASWFQIARDLTTGIDQVHLVVNYSVTEIGGDRTWYSGVNRVTVYQAPRGKHIVALKGSSVDKIFHAGTHEIKRPKVKGNVRGYPADVGNLWGWRSFPSLSNSGYWKRLEFQGDTHHKDTHKHIGVRGEIAFQVILEDK